MPTRFVVTCCLCTVMPSAISAADPFVEPTFIWSGKIEDESLRKIAPPSGFISDSETWKKVWTSWRRRGEELPKIDFSKELILVGTVPGPNLVLMRPTIDDDGNVEFAVGGTKIGGPGFGYRLMKLSKENVKTVNGQALRGVVEDSITVTVVGTLRTGIAAIGGETTGTTITAKGITWELDFGKLEALRENARKLSGRKVVVAGSLLRRKGVEIRERWIVTVTRLKAAVGERATFGVRVGQPDSGIRVAKEGDKTIIDITSKSGIGKTTIRRDSNEWPSILVRLHLSGLELFKAGGEDAAVEWSVSGTGKNATRVSLRKGGEELSLDEKSPYHTTVRIVDGNSKIPLKGGYYEVALPVKLFEGNPDEIKLRWIDFYRD